MSQPSKTRAVRWVERGATDPVKSIRYEGAERARPAPGVVEAVREADVVVLCPSNPVASIGPILAVPGIREALASRRSTVSGVSPIVGGAPLRGMADKLLPVAGVAVTAAAVAGHYAELMGAWVMDRQDAQLETEVRSLGLRTAVTDTIMRDDASAEALARVALHAAERGA